MFCENCGEKLKEGAEICLACGKVVPAAKAVRKTAAKVAEKKSDEQKPVEQKPVQEVAVCNKPIEVKTTGQVLAIIGFVMSFLSITVGSICSWIALLKIKYQDNKELRGIALAGLIISLAKLGLIVFSLFIYIVSISGAYYVL